MQLINHLPTPQVRGPVGGAVRPHTGAAALLRAAVRCGRRGVPGLAHALGRGRRQFDVPRLADGALPLDGRAELARGAGDAESLRGGDAPVGVCGGGQPRDAAHARVESAGQCDRGGDVRRSGCVCACVLYRRIPDNSDMSRSSMCFIYLTYQCEQLASENRET